MPDFTPSFTTIVEFFVVWVIWRGIVVRWFSEIIRKHAMEPSGKWLRKYVIRSQREMAIWLHYRNKALNKGHQCRLMECDDEWCRLI